MNKIIVIGCPGSGKSYFSKKLKDILDVSLYHLDLIWNKPDKTTISREEFDEILNDIFKEETPAWQREAPSPRHRYCRRHGRYGIRSSRMPHVRGSAPPSNWN